MLYVIFIIPLLVIIVGYLLYKYPPKKINYLVGYRTFKSMKDEKVWEYANRYCGSLWIKIGLVLLVISLILFALVYFKIIIFTEVLLLIITFSQVGVIILSSLVIENKIKKH